MVFWDAGVESDDEAETNDTSKSAASTTLETEIADECAVFIDCDDVFDDQGGPSAPLPAATRNRDDSSDSDDDIPLTQRAKVIARKWVEKNKINKLLDKDAEAYVRRVRLLLTGGEGDRRLLRARKSDEAASNPAGLNAVLVATEARLYYTRVTKRHERRPNKILQHQDYPQLGRYYLLLWHDPGYGGQDVEEWKPADFALQFDGLVEDYRKVWYRHCMHLLPLLISCWYPTPIILSSYVHMRILLHHVSLSM